MAKELTQDKPRSQNDYAQGKKLLLSVSNLKKYFPVGKKSLFNREQKYVHANESITLDIYAGETLGLVGESGCGKSTFGRTLIQLYDQTEGSTLYYGQTLAEMAPAYVKQVIRKLGPNLAAYKKAEQELQKLKQEASKLSGLAKAEIAEKIMFKTREIENKYLNMPRIAGGLLSHEQLDTVSTKLEAVYQCQVALAKHKRESLKLEASRSAKQNAGKTEKQNEIDQKIAALDGEIIKLQAELVLKEAEVEALREQCKAKPDFAKYEAMRDEGVDLSCLSKEEMRNLRKDLQIIFQDPYSSLDTRMTIGQIISEGVLAHGIFKNKRDEGYNEYLQGVMRQCGLDPYFIHRYPHQFSGGQRQRIGISRALALQPRFIVCDEAVSALDVSIQSQIINLLQDLAENNNLTYLFITHDLSVVRYISDRIGVMYLGNIVELAESEKIFSNPMHPYTKALLEAIPRTDMDSDQQLSILEGDIPSAVNPPSGCRFHTRCKYANVRCTSFEPEYKEVEPGHYVACHLLDMTEAEKEAALKENESKAAVAGQ